MVPTTRCCYGTMITILILAICASIIPSQASRDKQTAKLQKDYATLNKYLEKNLSTDCPVTNLEKLEQLLEEKSSKCTSLLCGTSLINTLRLIHKFTTIPTEHSLCHGSEGRLLMEAVDAGLKDESRFVTPNHLPKRMDRIIEHYNYEIIRRCTFDMTRPVMKYGSKQIAYDDIDNRLKDALPADEDVEKNMDKAEEILQQLNPQNGALAEALRQFLKLKLTLDEKTCNMDGFEILFRNELATRGKAYQHWGLRRVDKILLDYSQKHEKLCQPIVRKTLGLELKDLHRNSYLRVLGLVSFYYLGQHDLTAIVESLNRKQVDGDFVIAPMKEYAKRIFEKTAPFIKLDQILSISADELYDYIRAISEGDQSTISFNPPVDKEYNKQIVDDKQHRKLLNEYLYNPCERFLEAVGPSVEADRYGVIVNGRHLVSARENFLDDLSYHMIRAGYQACKYIGNSQDYIRKDMRKCKKLLVVLNH